MKEADLKKLLKRVFELIMPDLRHYYRMPRKGRIVKSYASDGQYWADVQPLRNDDSDDANEPLISRVEIPIMWGGPERGIVCPPLPGTLCDITYYDGDPNYPRISNFRWAKNKAPACELGAFVIQQAPGVFFRITPDGDIEAQAAQKMTFTAPIVEFAATTKVLATTPLLQASTNIVAGQNVSDQNGAKSMAGMRETYNTHTHQENGAGGGVTNQPGQGM